MRSKFWSFVEACDETPSGRGAKDLLAATLRELGVSAYALAPHAPLQGLGSLGVLIHNWSKEAIDHLFTAQPDGRINPVFEAVERTGACVFWSAPWAGSLRKDQRDWLIRLGELVGENGVTRAMRSTVVNASCSIASQQPLDAERIRACMRVANYAYHHLLYLQTPQLSEPERLTAREHECLYRAAVHGERPSLVARRLGVKVSTVRTLRQKAYTRLDAESPEQAVWRMIETGQLFRIGRKRRPRTW